MRRGWAVTVVLVAAVACGEALTSAEDDPVPDGGAPLDSSAESATPPDDGAPVDAGCHITWDAAGRTFSDISTGDKGGTDIQGLAEAGVLDPCAYNNFCPKDAALRREALRWAVRAASQAPPIEYACGTYFTDIDPNSSDFAYVHKARELGLTSGCGPNAVCPDIGVGRSSVASIAALISLEPFPDASVSRFADVPPGHPALRQIELAADRGFLLPCPIELADASVDAGPDASYFCPESSASKGDVAIALARARALRW